MPSDANFSGRDRSVGMAEMARCAERRDITRARAIARRVAATVADQPEAIARLSLILEDLEALDIAEEVVGAAIRRYPDELWIAVRHAVIAERRRDMDVAMARWSDIRLRWPEAAIGGIGLAGTLLARGDDGGAEQLYREITTRFPHEVWAADGLAAIASARRDWPTAVALWRDVRARFPDHTRATEHLAEALDQARGGGDYAEAIAAEDAGNFIRAARCWRSVIDAFPDRPEPVLRLARIDTMLGRPRHRVDTLREAAARFPDHLGIRLALLDAAEADGDDTLAIDTLARLGADASDERTRTRIGAALRRLLDTAARYQDFRRTLLLALATPGDAAHRAVARFLCETALVWPDRRAWARRVFDETTGMPDTPGTALVHFATFESLLGNLSVTPFPRGPESPAAPSEIRFLPVDTTLDDAATSPLEAMRHWAIAMLRHLNPFVLDRRLRHYQAEIVSSGAISFGDLYNGTPPAFAGCIYYSEPKAFAYRYVADGAGFWLITGEAADGYRIVAIHDETSAAVFFDPAHPPGDFQDFLGRRVRDIGDAHASGLTRRVADRREIVLVSGYDNYAHYMWNELPALLDISDSVSTKIDSIAVVFEPFSPFAEIAVWPGSPPVRLTSHAEISRAGNFHMDLLFAPGSTVVTPAARQRLYDACHPLAPREFLFEPTRAFTIWISLRRMYRRAVNLHALLERVFARIESARIACDVILDGFSTPYDLDAPRRYDSAYFLRHRDMAAADARTLIEAVGPRCLKIRLLDATMADIPTAIALTSRANFYLCHHGTQQHKIGWIADIPGVIHGNETLCRQDSIARWVQAQCDSPIQPRYIPADFIRDTVTDNDRQELPTFRDYSFLALDACADFVFAELQAAHDQWRAAPVTRPRWPAAPKGSTRDRSAHDS